MAEHAPDDDQDGEPDDSSGPPPPPSSAPASSPSPARRRRVPRWLGPAVLVTVAIGSAAGAVRLDRSPTAAAVGTDARTATPVLSARRVPEVVADQAGRRRLATDLDAWVARSPADTCLVVASGDDTLFAHNPTAPLAGASTQKIVTASALVQALGPDARLETAVRAGAAPADGVVAGDLYVVGGGDPLLTSPGYAQRMQHAPTLAVDPVRLADAVVAAGVTRVDGSVVGDGTRYDGERFHPSWPTRFHATEAGPIGALTVNDGRAGADGASRPPDGAAGDDPAANAAAVVTDLLRLRGVTVVGAPRSGPAPAGLTDVATVPSSTVREIVAEMLTDSDDDTAEMALKELGRRASGAGTWAAGTAATTDVLADAGVDLDGVRIVDGSGLSIDNRLTCGLLVDLLNLPDSGPTVVEGLAVAGETGTLQDRWDGTPVAGRLVAKTGTLNTVTALSGQVSPLQGGAVTFAYVTNVPAGQYVGADVVALQDGLGEILVDHPRGIDVATLLPAEAVPTEAVPTDG